MDHITVGIDMSKAKFDIFISSQDKYLQFPNDKSGFSGLNRKLRPYKKKIFRIVIEHTGGYQNNLVTYLQEHLYPVSVVNSADVRHFAKASRQFAKTDKIDAKVLAVFGSKFEPKITQPTDKNRQEMRQWNNYRLQLSNMHKQLMVRRQQNICAEIAKLMDKDIKYLEAKIKEANERIYAFIAESKELAAKSTVLEKVRGVGKQTAAVLLAELPELGKIGRNQITALCGLAPMNRDSGTMHGKAFIQGGRRMVRNALYMAAMSGIRYNDVLHAYYTRLSERGKPFKVAIVAVMHKLLLCLNSRLQNL